MSFHLVLRQNHVSIIIILTLLIENLGNNVTQLLNIKIVMYKPHILNPGSGILSTTSGECSGRGQRQKQNVLNFDEHYL